MSANTCEEVIFGSGFGRGHECGRRANVEHGGKWFCGTHDPVKRKERQARRDADWRAERRGVELKQRLTNAELALGRVVADCHPLALPPEVRDAHQAVLSARAALSSSSVETDTEAGS